MVESSDASALESSATLKQSIAHQRKALMAERADAFLALPGGIGTFEELFEVWAWRQLGYHDKPLGLLNVNGCYDSLLGFLNQTVDNGFVSTWQMDLLHVGTGVQQLLPTLRTAAAGVHQRVQTEQM